MEDGLVSEKMSNKSMKPTASNAIIASVCLSNNLLETSIYSCLLLLLLRAALILQRMSLSLILASVASVISGLGAKYRDLRVA